MVPIFEAVGLACALIVQAKEPAAVDEFEKRVRDYATLHRKLDGELGHLKPRRSMEETMNHQRELAQHIAEARQSAAQGEIFTPAVAGEFRSLIAFTMQGKRARRIRRSLAGAEPVRLEVRVNASYPNDVPLQSTPPSLLLNLPKLPKEVDYRLVGRNLVLRDTEANLIVDFIPGAIP